MTWLVDANIGVRVKVVSRVFKIRKKRRGTKFVSLPSGGGYLCGSRVQGAKAKDSTGGV